MTVDPFLSAHADMLESVIATGERIARAAITKRVVLINAGMPPEHPTIVALDRVASDMLAMSAGARYLAVEAEVRNMYS